MSRTSDPTFGSAGLHHGNVTVASAILSAPALRGRAIVRAAGGPEGAHVVRGRPVRRLALMGMLALGGCASAPSQYLVDYAEPHPTPDHFQVCHGYGCKLATRVALSADEWRRVRAAFEPAAST